MSFKNAFKILISRFSYVWVVLLYIILLLVIVGSLGLTFLRPVYEAFSDAGVWSQIGETVRALVSEGSLTKTVESAGKVLNTVRDIFVAKPQTYVNSMLFVILIATFAYRFIMGLSELPLVSVINGMMSDNAKYSFSSKFVSHLGKSAYFSLIKMLIMVAYDSLMYTALFLAVKFVYGIGTILVPFAFMFVLIIFLTFRYTLISAWTPYMIVEKKGVIKSFGKSVVFGFRHFAPLFSTWMITWVLIISINFLVGLFTFFVGLIVTVPLSVYFVSLINMTFFYGRKKLTYYIDGNLFIPEQITKQQQLNK